MTRNQKLGLVSAGLFFFTLYTYVPSLSTYATSLGASYTMVGMITAAYGLAQTVFRLPLGIMSDRTGRRRVFITLSMLVSLAAAVVVLLTQSPVSLLVSRLLGGMAASGWVVMTILFTGLFREDETHKAIGMINAINHTGQLAAVSSSGFIAAQFGTLANYSIAAVAAVVAMIMSFFLPKDNRETKHKTKGLMELLRIGAQKSVLAASLLTMVNQFITFATVYGFTPILAEKLGAGDVEKGLLTTLYTLTAIGGSMLSAKTIARFNLGRMTAVIFSLFGITCIYLPFATHLYIIFCIQLLSGFLRGLQFSQLMSLAISGIDAEKRVTAMGFFQAIYGIGMTLGPSIVGLVGDLAGLTAGFVLTGAVAFAAGFAALIVYRKRPV